MIIGIFGLPGVGKSTVLAMFAKKAQKHKRCSILPSTEYERVYSNFYISGCYELEFDRLGLEDFHDCLMLIDEISLYADSRDYKNFPKHLNYFFKLHRHYGIDIVYCSQSYQDCDKRIRDITDCLYQINLSWFGFSRVREISKHFGVNQGRIEEYYEPTGIGSFCYRKRYYKMFDSYERKRLPEVTALEWDFPLFSFKFTLPFFKDKENLYQLPITEPEVINYKRKCAYQFKTPQRTAQNAILKLSIT